MKFDPLILQFLHWPDNQFS